MGLYAKWQIINSHGMGKQLVIQPMTACFQLRQSSIVQLNKARDGAVFV